MQHLSKVKIMLQWESNADESLSVNTEEKYQYQRGKGTSLTNHH